MKRLIQVFLVCLILLLISCTPKQEQLEKKGKHPDAFFTKIAGQWEDNQQVAIIFKDQEELQQHWTTAKIDQPIPHLKEDEMVVFVPLLENGCGSSVIAVEQKNGLIAIDVMPTPIFEGKVTGDELACPEIAIYSQLVLIVKKQNEPVIELYERWNDSRQITKRIHTQSHH